MLFLEEVWKIGVLKESSINGFRAHIRKNKVSVTLRTKFFFSYFLRKHIQNEFHELRVRKKMYHKATLRI